MWLIDDNGRSKHLYRKSTRSASRWPHKSTRCHEIWLFCQIFGAIYQDHSIVQLVMALLCAYGGVLNYKLIYRGLYTWESSLSQIFSFSVFQLIDIEYPTYRV